MHRCTETAAIGKWHLGMGYGKLDWNKEIVPSGNTVGFDYTNLIPAQTLPVEDKSRLESMKATFLGIVGSLYSLDTAVDPLE